MLVNLKSEKIFRKPYTSCKGSCDAFDNYLTSSINKHAQKTKNVLRRNEKPHISKNSRGAITKRSKLKDKARKEREREREGEREKERERQREKLQQKS